MVSEQMQVKFIESLQYAIKTIRESDIVKYIDDVILYGSCARGDYKVSSDIDLLLVFDSDKDIHMQLIQLAGCVSPSNTLLPEVDLHFLSKETYKNENSTYISAVREDGKSIWVN